VNHAGELYFRSQKIVRALRQELLFVATVYGVLVSIEDGDEHRRGEWLGWLEYEKCLDVRIAVLGGEFGWQSSGGESASAIADSTDWLVDLLRDCEVHGRESIRGAVADTLERYRWELLERLALRARAVEELRGEPLNEVEGEEHPEALALLGAVEDSLLLSSLQEGDGLSLRATSAEVYLGLIGARGEGIWDFLKPGSTGPRQAAPTTFVVPVAERVTEMAEMLLVTFGQTAVSYVRLAPDGRELTEDDRSDALERLETGGRCLRRLQANWNVVQFLAEQENERGQLLDLRPTIMVQRVMNRSLVLSLSRDQALRMRAISAPDLGDLVIPIRAFWKDFPERAEQHP